MAENKRKLRHAAALHLVKRAAVLLRWRRWPGASRFARQQPVGGAPAGTATPPHPPAKNAAPRGIRLPAVAVLGLAMAGAAGVVLGDFWRPAPAEAPQARAGLALQNEAAAAPDASLPASRPDMAQAPGAAGDTEAATDALLDEVNRLLRLADRLDADIDRMVGKAADAARGPDAPLPEPATAVAAFLPFPGQGGGTPTQPLAPAETPAALVAPPRALRPVPAEPVPVMPPAERLAGRVPEAATAQAAAPPATAQAAAPPATRARFRAPPRAETPAAASQAVLTAAQTRCAAITLRVQLGEEPSHDETRFLRSGCR